MADGTTLNGVEARRIHRTNAHEVRADAERMLTYYRERLLVLAAMSPMHIDEGDSIRTWDAFVQGEVADIVDEMRREWWREFCANYIIDYPRDVVDDYDQIKKEDAR